METKPQAEADAFVPREIAAIREQVIRARRMLDPHDPKQGPAWRELDSIEAKLSGLLTIL